MNVLRYFKERVMLVVAVLLVAGFAGASTALGERNGVYVALVGGVIVTIYLIFDYARCARHVQALKKLADAAGTDWVTALPAPLTEEQRAYQQLLKKLTDTASAQLSDAQMKSAEELEFLTLWVHEIKTPIAAAKLIIEAGLSAPDERTLYALEDELNRIENDVQTSLFYVRADAFEQDYCIGSASLATVTDECLQNEFTNINGKSLHIERAGLDKTVESDGKWLTFIVRQVLDNAVKYSHAGGTVRITAERDADETRLTVADEGVGIRQEDMRRVFEKSFTGANGRQYYNSTGIGLYLADKLARKLGHRLEIRSEYGKGTAVTLHFPSDDPWRQTKAD